MRLALIAPPTSTVPPSWLGGLDQVRWLADGLAARSHHVTLIGAGLGGICSTAYTIVDTGEHDSTDADSRHASAVGKYLAENCYDVVSDHTAGYGYLPQRSIPIPTVRTVYAELPPGGPELRTPAHVGPVTISDHQRHHARSITWLATIHPAIPVADDYHVSLDHAGPCLFLGPLLPLYGALFALHAAHEAGLPIILAGTQPSDRSYTYTQQVLLPELWPEDELHHEITGLRQRWDLIATARCLIAPLPPRAPYSLEMIEAMACGTPVVGLAGTVAAELIAHCASGIIAPTMPQLPRAIKDAIALDPKQVRQVAEDRYDLPRMVEAYEEVFIRFTTLPSAATRPARRRGRRT